MKLRYIFFTLIACLGLFASCNDDQTLDSLDQVQVSQSFVALSKDGGSETVTIKANGDWKLQLVTVKNKQTVYVDSVPTWLKITPTQGGAGETNVVISAEAATKSLSDNFVITCNGSVQRLMVQQQTEKVDLPLSSCADVISGADGDTYKVRGTVTRIANTTYGNWYLNDGTGEVYIYGTLDASGAEKNFTSLGIEAGDEVTVQGPKTTYGSTIELVNVSVISINKSLIKVDSLSTETLPKEGGEITAYITCKGEGVSVELPEDVQNWISVKSVITSGTSAKVVLKVAANEKGKRTASLGFTTTSNGKTYTSTTEFSQEGSIVECSISDFLDNTKSPTGAIYRITGVITQVKSDTYGNCYIKDATGETYVYGIGSKGDFAAKGLKVGDVVTLTGAKDIYNGTPQMKSATLEAVKPVTKVTVAEFLSKEDNNDVYYMLTGKVSNIKSDTYGNYDLVDETSSVYIYGTLAGWGGASKQFASFGIAEGDEISVITIKTSYNGSAQGKNAFLFTESNY